MVNIIFVQDTISVGISEWSALQDKFHKHD